MRMMQKNKTEKKYTKILRIIIKEIIRRQIENKSTNKK